MPPHRNTSLPSRPGVRPTECARTTSRGLLPRLRSTWLALPLLFSPSLLSDIGTGADVICEKWAGDGNKSRSDAGMRRADLPPTAYTTGTPPPRQLARSRPLFSQSGVPCSFVEPLLCSWPCYRFRCSSCFSRLITFPGQTDSLVTQVSCSPRTVVCHASSRLHAAAPRGALGRPR